MEKININTDFIKLESAMKFVGIVGSGGESKIIIQSGEVSVNGKVCTERGKKLREGDAFEFDGKIYSIGQAK